MHPCLKGFTLALPIVLGYMPIGFAYGILAVQAGFSPFFAGIMSFLVFAGSGQFIATSLVSAGASTASVILTTFIVNLRHLLMSAALTPHLRNWSKLRQLFFGLEMTDETFAVNLARFTQHGVVPLEAFTVNSFSHFGWCFGGFVGAYFGSLIGDMERFGLDYALPAMFIALMLPHLQIPKRTLAVILGAGLSVIFALLGADQWSVILATICAAFLASISPLSGKDSNATKATSSNEL